MRRFHHSYYILMVDYGRDTSKAAHGLEAVVSPEKTRRDIVDQVREILKSDSKTVEFVKLVDGHWIEDVTKEIIAEAREMEDA